MYYRLKEPWAFRGWKKLPYAVRALYGEHKHDMPIFLDGKTFVELLYCNGEENVNTEDLRERTRQVIREFISKGMMEESESPLPPLSGAQRYGVYPSRYLELAHWSITGKCNFRCRHCMVSAPSARHPQLPLEDCLRIVESIAQCGIRRVDLTGGEPLLRSDFEEIVRELTKYNIDIGTLFTNASLLSQETLDMLHSHHQHPTFQLSFDGLGHHDWLRGVPGAEKQADEAFRLLKSCGARVSVAMCIHRENRDSLRATVNYLASLGVEAMRVNAPQELGVWKQYSKEYALSHEEVWQVYKEYIPQFFEDGMPLKIELDGFFSCPKGDTAYSSSYVHHPKKGSDWSKYPYCESVRYNVYIGPEGRLAPCMGFSDHPALRDRFPSMLETPLRELSLGGYYYDLVNTKVSDLLEKNPACAECVHLPACCGGCMVESITEDGDYLVPDQRCCYFHKHIGEQTVRQIADAAILAVGLHPGMKKKSKSEKVPFIETCNY